MSSLYFAVYVGDVDEVKRLLLDGRCDVNCKVWFVGDKTPLHVAAEGGHEDIVKLLLEHGADPNITAEDGRTPLHLAEEEGYENIVKLLLQRGADPNITDMDGSTPLHEAAAKGHGDTVKLLLERGADLNITNMFGETPLHGAAERGRADIVKLLLEHGADPNITNEWRITPLHKAACGGHKGTVKLLLEHGADLNITNMFGETPLHGAAERGRADIVKLLLEHGDDPNITNKYGSTPLHEAAMEGREDTVKLLLERGADPNITSKCGRTPLHAAADGGHGDIVKLLLERGADPNITDEEKLRPYDVAVKKNHEYIKIMLQRFSSPSIQTHLLQKVITAISEQASVRDIRFLARKQLGIPNSKLENIRCQNTNDAQEEAFQILWEWMKTKSGMTVHNLFKALKDQQLNECLDKIRDEYAALLNNIWAMPEDEFQKFHSSLQPTKSSIDDVTLSNMAEMNLRCYFSDDLESLYVPVESSNANTKGDDNDSHKVVLRYRFAGKGVCRNVATPVKMNE